MGELIIVLVGYFVSVAICGSILKSRGYEKTGAEWGWGLFSVIGWIVCATKPDRRILNAMSQLSQINQPNISITDELKGYKELLDQGVITQGEFNKKKAELLRLGDD